MSFIEAIPHKCHLKVRLSSAFLLGFSFLIFCLVCYSCNSTKEISIESIQKFQVPDTIALHNILFDSVYVDFDHYIDRSKDTIPIRQPDVEYKYKLLRDTIEHIKLETQHDSIPYEVRITEIKEVRHTQPWIEALAYIGFISILVLLIYIFTKLKCL